MKKIFIFLFSVLPFFCSCEYEDFSPEEWAVEPELSVSKASIVQNSLARTDTIKIETNYKEFSVGCDASWCHVTMEKDSSWVIISTDPNTTTDVRNTEVVVNIKRGKRSLSREISVVQFGGSWTMIGQFPVFLAYELDKTQMEILTEIINKLVFVKGATFNMGGQTTDPIQLNYVPNTLYLGYPSHPVTLTDYYIGSTEITQREWNAIMGTNNSRFKGANKPVDNITWDEAMEFVSTLSSLTRLNICLPTEAQWEFAARGGIYSRGYLYSGSNDWKEVANNIESLDTDDTDVRYATKDVASLLPNELGLYDMSGNVAELCADWYSDDDVYESGITNPVGPATDYNQRLGCHVYRGGDFTVRNYYISSYNRLYVGKNPHTSGGSMFSEYYGFRIVLIP